MSSITKLLLVGNFMVKNPRSGRAFMQGKVGVEGHPEELFDIFVNDLNGMQAVVRKLEALEVLTSFGAKNIVIDRIAKKALVNHNTKFFYKIAGFDFPDEIVQNYLSPPVLNIAQVKASPTKKRVSVMANVEEVGQVRNVAGGKRIRTVSLNDGEESIRLSLWEEHTDIPIHINDRIKIECVEVSEWNNIKQLDSTSAMRVEPVVMNDEDKTGQVIALTSDNLELPYELIFECDGTEYEVTVNDHSNIEVNLHHLPTRGILSIRQEGMVMVCVRLRQDDV